MMILRACFPQIQPSPRISQGKQAKNRKANFNVVWPWAPSLQLSASAWTACLTCTQLHNRASNVGDAHAGMQGQEAQLSLWLSPVAGCRLQHPRLQSSRGAARGDPSCVSAGSSRRQEIALTPTAALCTGKMTLTGGRERPCELPKGHICRNESLHVFCTEYLPCQRNDRSGGDMLRCLYSGYLRVQGGEQAIHANLQFSQCPCSTRVLPTNAGGYTNVSRCLSSFILASVIYIVHTEQLQIAQLRWLRCVRQQHQ